MFETTKQVYPQPLLDVSRRFYDGQNPAESRLERYSSSVKNRGLS